MFHAKNPGIYPPNEIMPKEKSKENPKHSPQKGIPSQQRLMIVGVFACQFSPLHYPSVTLKTEPGGPRVQNDKIKRGMRSRPPVDVQDGTHEEKKAGSGDGGG
jgi:hypothetical protein